jgi:hypothetical protein
MLRRGTPLSQRWTKIIFIALGTALLCGGAVWGWKTWSFASNAKTAVGKVVRIEERVTTRNRVGKPDRRSVSQLPVFTFRDDEGQEHTATSPASEGKNAYQIGQAVPVLYRPENPDDASINTFTQMWLGPMVIGILGLAFGGLGFFPRRS